MLKELLEKQREMTDYLTKNKFKRIPTAYDILISLLAELIEFNEEMELQYNHKVWKIKEFNKKNMEIEMVDALFFILQYLNKIGVTDAKAETYEHLLVNCCCSDLTPYDALREMIKCVGIELGSKTSFPYMIVASYRDLYMSMGYTHTDIQKLYMEKFNYNMEREDFKNE